MSPLPVLFLDEYLVAINKPAGMLVHRTGLDRNERENAMHIVRDQLGRWVYPLHRLDKATSGVLLFALDRETARLMTQAFVDGAIAKSYLAVVRGITDASGRIEHPLKELEDRTPVSKEGRERPGRNAVTEYRRAASVELPHPVGRYPTARYSLIEASPITGRSHQIRRHMKHIFHPVVGDTTHGDGKHNEFFRAKLACRRLLLHARRVGFSHPHDGRQMSIEAPLDSAFRELLTKLPRRDAACSDQQQAMLPQDLPLHRP